MVTPRRKLLVVLAGSLAWGLQWRHPGEDPSLKRVREAGKLRVGLDPSYPPFGNVDASGRLDGLDVDLARELAERLGVAAEFVTLDVGGLLDAVVARQCDVAIGIAPVRDFLKDLRYSRPYFNAGQVLVVRADTAKAGSTRPVGPGQVVGVESGSGADLQGALVAERLGKPELRRVTSVDALKAELAAGQLDGIVLDAVTAYELLKTQPGLALGAGPLTREPYVIAVHRYDAALLKQIDATLDALEREGYLQGLVKKWLY